MRSSFLPGFPRFFRFRVSVGEDVIRSGCDLLHSVRERSVGVIRGLIYISKLFYNGTFVLIPFNGRTGSVGPDDFLK